MIDVGLTATVLVAASIINGTKVTDSRSLCNSHRERFGFLRKRILGMKGVFAWIGMESGGGACEKLHQNMVYISSKMENTGICAFPVISNGLLP